MSFRFSGKSIFLTYSRPLILHASFTLEQLQAFLNSFEPSYSIVAQEQHQDGTDHYHALLTWDKIKNWKNPKKFDFEGWHPNWQKPRSVKASQQYVKKDGNFLETGELLGKVDYLDKAKECDTKSEWMSWCVQAHISIGYAEYFWKEANPSPTATILEAPTDGSVSNALANFTFDHWKTHSCILVGPSGCGKTVWAKRNAPKPALMVSHLDQLRDFDSLYHKSIIFDDMTFKHFPVTSQIHLVDQYDDRAIHCRYQVALIPKHTPKIFTCNEKPFDDHPAIIRRTKYFLINLF